MKNRGNCLVFLSTQDEVLNSQRSSEVLSPFYEIIWDESESHKFKKISHHLQKLKAFKNT